MKKLWKFLLDNSLLLVIGAVIALVWANLGESANHLYHNILHLHWSGMNNPFWGTEIDPNNTIEHLGQTFTMKRVDVHFIINDLLMAFFFMSAGKEVFEATFPGGALHNPKQAATPLIATAGGVLGPILVYCLLAHFVSPMFGYSWAGGADPANALYHGWAVPTATDIAFSAMIARIIFGGRHPAVPFLLLLAIADDAVGLVIIALAFGSGFGWNTVVGLGITGIAMCVAYFLFNKKLHWNSWVPYFLLMLVTWLCFGYAGIHCSLGFIPIVVCMPHAAEDDGVHSDDERGKEDALNKLQTAFYVPTEVILGLFGWASAGVAFTTIGFPTACVALALILGKPLGIFTFGSISGKFLGLPGGMTHKDLIVLGSAAGIGFTVALFVAGVAFPDGSTKDAAKLGALLSLCSMFVAYGLAKALKIKRMA